MIAVQSRCMAQRSAGWRSVPPGRAAMQGGGRYARGSGLQPTAALASAHCQQHQPQHRMLPSQASQQAPDVSLSSRPRSRHAPTRRPVTVAASGNNGSSPVVEVVNEAAAISKGQLLSLQLNQDVRQRAEQAIAARGYSVTVGDVAAAGGLTLLQAEQALRALAADSLATLQVSEAGEVLYVFARNFKEAIRGRSLLLGLEPAVATAAAALGYLGRVAFGTALIVSVATVLLALTAIATSSSRDDRDQRGGIYHGGPRFFFNLTDLLWYWDPWYYRRRRLTVAQEQAKGEGMNFLEAIFSVVFGDGDANQDYEKRRWEAIGAYIQYRGGVVTAEELAPFLDLTPQQLASDRGMVVVNESYVLPVLARLRGEPVVDGRGDIVYRFPELQETSKARQQQPQQLAAFEERQKLTAASSGQLMGVLALGLVNLVGVAALGQAIATPAGQVALIRNGLAWVLSAMPLLQAYASAFFAVPMARWYLQWRANAHIDERNAGRKAALKLLQSPDATLRTKLEAAEALADQRRVLAGSDRVVYRTDRDVSSQPVDLEADDFDQRLQQRAEQRQASDTPLWWRQQQQQQRREQEG